MINKLKKKVQSINEILDMIKKMEKDGIIQKPTYRIIYSYPCPIYRFNLSQ